MSVTCATIEVALFGRNRWNAIRFRQIFELVYLGREFVYQVEILVYFKRGLGEV